SSLPAWVAGRKAQRQKFPPPAWSQFATKTCGVPARKKGNSALPIIGSTQASVDHGDVETLGQPCCLDAGQVVVGTRQNEIDASQRAVSEVGNFTIVGFPLRIRERAGEGSAQSRGLRSATVAGAEKYRPRKIGRFDLVRINHDRPSRAQQAQILQ